MNEVGIAVKCKDQQGAATVYHTRNLLVRQRTQMINAFRAHLAEQGIVAQTGPLMSGVSPQSLTAATAR